MDDDDKTPMERLQEPRRKVFSERKVDLKKPKASEEDAEEVLEGGIPPSGEAADE
jgi:hypothetical protein